MLGNFLLLWRPTSCVEETFRHQFRYYRDSASLLSLEIVKIKIVDNLSISNIAIIQNLHPVLHIFKCAHSG